MSAHHVVFHRLLLASYIVLGMTGCREEIVHNLSEGDSHRVFSLLSGRGIASGRVRQPDGRWAISVEQGEVVTAIQSLTESRILRSDVPGSVAESPSILSGREEHRFRYERSVSGSIESTLRSLDGVREARVHLNLPETDPLLGRSRSTEGSSGSVLLVVGEDFRGSREEISHLVSGATGIAATAVSVLVSAEPVSHREEGGEANRNPPAGDPVGRWRFVIGIVTSLICIVVGAGTVLHARRRHA